MSTGELVERHELEDFDESITRFQRILEEAARSGALGPEQLQRLTGTVRQAAARANEEVLPRIDADAANEISQRLIAILTSEPGEGAVLDAADQYLMDLEAIRHVLRDLLEEQQPQLLRKDSTEIIALVEGWLPSASVGDLAALLGLSVRQLQRRRHDVGVASSREQLVARLVASLRHAWTDAGVFAWFGRPRDDLGGKAPIQLLDDPQGERALLIAARSGRVQGGS